MGVLLNTNGGLFVEGAALATGNDRPNTGQKYFERALERTRRVPFSPQIGQKSTIVNNYCVLKIFLLIVTSRQRNVLVADLLPDTGTFSERESVKK